MSPDKRPGPVYYFVIVFLLVFAKSAQLETRNDFPIVSKESPEPEVKISSYDYKAKIPPSSLVVVKNPYGSIRSRNHFDDAVFLHATIQEIGKEPLKPKFSIEQRNDHLFIEVEYPEAIRDSQGNLRGRVDVAVLFPQKVSIYAETDFGLIKIDKTSSHVEAKTSSGDIKLATTGLFKLSSETGAIKIDLRGSRLAGTSHATTKSGNIIANIFNDMEIKLKAQSKGKVTLAGGKPGESGEYLKGDANVRVSLSSDTGRIEINPVEPPELLKSEKPSNVNSVDVDLRELPKSKSWKPGDPVYEMEDRNGHEQRSRKN
ncbi:DUF4097 family beta strand repeat-containing protein [Aliikangiella sp. G2MR2-5]|uniref:DUF4097 family beta strand repeat-containing protein n=1 Tax=Aliikangiella sp. G2MR2-5 TaxID=2788943 RepID=UPI0018A8AF58|nr:DUF4097 family beta strand repeat-containing protein [Aliikangiella sp. G2MR2-5]